MKSGKTLLQITSTDVSDSFDEDEEYQERDSECEIYIELDHKELVALCGIERGLKLFVTLVTVCKEIADEVCNTGVLFSNDEECLQKMNKLKSKLNNYNETHPLPIPVSLIAAIIPGQEWNQHQISLIAKRQGSEDICLYITEEVQSKMMFRFDNQMQVVTKSSSGYFLEQEKRKSSVKNKTTILYSKIVTDCKFTSSEEKRDFLKSVNNLKQRPFVLSIGNVVRIFWNRVNFEFLKDKWESGNFQCRIKRKKETLVGEEEKKEIHFEDDSITLRVGKIASQFCDNFSEDEFEVEYNKKDGMTYVLKKLELDVCDITCIGERLEKIEKSLTKEER